MRKHTREEKIMKRFFCLTLVCAMLLCAVLPVQAEDTAWQVGDMHNGFVVTDVHEFGLIGADTITLRHDKTGALVMLLLNEDTNRVFNITFRTVAEDNTGTPHVFEHATLSGSEAYPSKKLFFNLSYQTYNTYMNAGTYAMMTSYPVSSLSEAQLLKYADFYLDSCFHPMIQKDESIFRREAWRYSLTDADAPMTITGTVYNEMKGAMTLESAANYNYKRTLAPGSVIGNVSGGEPASIPEMTWESLCTYHDTYYHPSNSLSFVYGKIEHPESFLALLDSVFSTYEARDVSGLFADEGYQPLTEAAEKVYSYPVEEGTDTENGAVIYYGFRCDDASTEDMDALDLFTTMANADSSAYKTLLKERLPMASGSVYVDSYGVPSVYFRATGVNASDADTFRAVVDESMARIAEEGFTLEEAEALEAGVKLEVLLTPEDDEVGVSIIENIAYNWSAAGRLYGYMEYIDLLNRFTEFVNDGTFCRMAQTYIVDNPIHVLAVTEPVAGLKEIEDAALAETLAEKKAAMTEDEIAALVAATNAAEDEGEDTAEMVAALSAVTVDTLPEEFRRYDISDDMLENNVRRLYVNAAGAGVGKTMLRLNVSSLPQEQLHWLALYMDLLGDMDTTEHTYSELSTLITRYANGMQIGVIIPTEDNEYGYTPYLRVAFSALDEDLAAAYDLVSEILFETDFSNTEMLSGRVGKIRNSLKQSINAEGYGYMLRRMFGKSNEGYAFYDYMNQLPYYEFLCEVEEAMASDPAAVTAKLNETRDALLALGNGAVYGYVGSEGGRAANNAAVEAFLSGLTAEEKARVKYEFEPVAESEGLILDVNTSFNLVFASWEELGLEKYTADWDAVCSLMNDRYMMPELRDARGAYGAYLYASDYGLYAFTYRDPNVAESFDVFSRIGEMLANDADITQDTLNGYILSSYSAYALPQGELTDGYNAMGNLLTGQSQEEKLANMEALKSVKVETLPEYAEVLSKLMTNGVYGTVSSASIISANAELYQTVSNPFGAVDASQVTLTDVPEDHPHYEAIRKAFEGGMMTAENGAFAPDRTLTLGEFAMPLYMAIGGTADMDEAIAFLSQYGIVPSAPADTELTREDAVSYGAYFCMAVGVDVQELTLGEYPDTAELSEGTDGIWAWMLENQLMQPTADGLLAPAAPMTRADYAELLANLL